MPLVVPLPAASDPAFAGLVPALLDVPAAAVTMCRAESRCSGHAGTGRTVGICPVHPYITLVRQHVTTPAYSWSFRTPGSNRCWQTTPAITDLGVLVSAKMLAVAACGVLR